MTVTVTLTGSLEPDVPEHYINTGTTTHVAIEVMDVASTQAMSNGKTLTIGINTEHKTSLALKSRMITPNGKATSGSVIGLTQLLNKGAAITLERILSN
ncbi:hypothetical protein [Buttiauxella agrestis]|uniref:hypothetical protein n=1 Tax=Buttiauxella agrestis TaxID=82977 RepID=UPI0011C07BA8|nr:hypothetical protein [Buttiauxella agrestis]